jgi:hypothetical protein
MRKPTLIRTRTRSQMQRSYTAQPWEPPELQPPGGAQNLDVRWCVYRFYSSPGWTLESAATQIRGDVISLHQSSAICDDVSDTLGSER